jgi:hypothetical protein
MKEKTDFHTFIYLDSLFNVRKHKINPRAFVLVNTNYLCTTNRNYLLLYILPTQRKVQTVVRTFGILHVQIQGYGDTHFPFINLLV